MASRSVGKNYWVFAVWLLNSQTCKSFQLQLLKMNIYGHTLLWELVKGGKYISKDTRCESSKRVKPGSRMEMALHSAYIRI